MTESLATDYRPNEWNDLVHKGQRLVGSKSSSQFSLGDIGLEMVPLPPKGKRPPMKAYKLLATYADEVGLERERFEEYRLVAGAWPKMRRVKNVCWTVHATRNRSIGPTEGRRRRHPAAGTGCRRGPLLGHRRGGSTSSSGGWPRRQRRCRPALTHWTAPSTSYSPGFHREPIGPEKLLSTITMEHDEELDRPHISAPVQRLQRGRVTARSIRRSRSAGRWCGV